MTHQPTSHSALHSRNMLAAFNCFWLLALALLCLPSAHCVARVSRNQPADHLLPPPPPPPPSLANALQPGRAAQAKRAEHYQPLAIPLAHYAAPRPQQHQQQLQQQSLPLPLPQSLQSQSAAPSWSTRLANWFGFGGGDPSAQHAPALDQQLAAQGPPPAAYAYPRPNQVPVGGAHQQRHKANCNLCSYHPWVPMWPAPSATASHSASEDHSLQQLPYEQQPADHQWAASQDQPNYYRFPDRPQYAAQAGQVPLQALLPTSPVVFHDFGPATPPAGNELPVLEYTPDHLGLPGGGGQHSTFIPTQIPPSVDWLPTERPATTRSPLTTISGGPAADDGFEIIKSHQLTHYISSVEYPTIFEQGKTIEINVNGGRTEGNSSPQTARLPAAYDRPTFGHDIDIYGSILQPLAEIEHLQSLGTSSTHDAPPNQQQSVAQPHTAAPQTAPSTDHHDRNVDNLPSASVHESHNTEVWRYQGRDEYQQTVATTTTTPPHIPSTTEDPHNGDHLQIFGHKSEGNAKDHDDRETPKHLLSYPSLRDHVFAERMPAVQSLEQKKETSTVASIPYAFLPTPTSIYSAIDASAHFAGMAPPPLPSTSTPSPTGATVSGAVQHAGSTGHLRPIIPYTINNAPRPFKPPRHPEPLPGADGGQRKPAFASIFEKWQSNNVDGEQQESKLVSSTAAPPPNNQRPPKYLTKILASNLRQLLRQEQHATTKAALDLSTLQKNIDDWTEQEYTSLSNRPSTPTIRGRSKHIPVEYLTHGTTSLHPHMQPKNHQLEIASALPASINNLESQLTDRIASKQVHYVESNHLADLATGATEPIARTSATNSRTTAVPAREAANKSAQSMWQYIKGFNEEVATPPPNTMELWRKGSIQISPLTNEKVYVVTPQPRLEPQRYAMNGTRAAAADTDGHAQKSPRFLVRPTPAGNVDAIRSSARSHSSEPFGLKGLSAYVPAGRIEIIAGNSKVITASTPTSTPATTTTDRYTIDRRKHTMSPLPR